MNNPTVLSLFSGIGGIDLGFINAGFNVIYANDFDHYACTTYKRNFLDTFISECDIRTISEENIPCANVLVAGFPCQSFSVMGYQRGFRDARGNLFFEIIRIAKHTNPDVIFLENVKNLIYHDNGRTFLTIYNSLVQLGYAVKYSVQNACTHGNIPQDRSRTFIVAFRDFSMMNRFAFPDEVPLKKQLNDIIDRTQKHSDCYYYKKTNRYYSDLNYKINDITGIYRIDDSGVAMKKYDISPTLKANMGTYHDRVPIIRDMYGIRKLTPYECLALQGFPEDFRFENIPMNEAYKQCGNTVCVPVVERIAKNIYIALKGEELR